ncbi:MAG: hypothetical protein ACPL3B_02530 [Fervidobacterium sp.]
MFTLLGAFCNIVQGHDILSSLSLGAGYGLTVYLVTFVLSFIPILGQVLLWFLVIPTFKDIFSITSKTIIIYDVAIMVYSIFLSLLAIFIMGALYESERGKYIR